MSHESLAVLLSLLVMTSAATALSSNTSAKLKLPWSWQPTVDVCNRTVVVSNACVTGSSHMIVGVIFTLPHVILVMRGSRRRTCMR